MNQIGFPLVSLAIALPALGALLVWLTPASQTRVARGFAMLSALGALATAVALVARFDASQAGYQLVDSVAWVAAWGLSYTVSVDGISLWLVVLTTLLTPVSLMASWNAGGAHPRLQQALLLLLAGAMTGVFVAQDMLLFYVFFELTLVPTALLIGIWGGDDRRRAAQTFLVYTFAGSVVMLVGIVGLYQAHGVQTGIYTFDLATVLASLQLGAVQLPLETERMLFAAFLIAFAVKLPLWPFHSWLTTAHTAAPSSGVVDIAGMVIKIGAYGLIRFNVQLFPQAAAWAAPAIGVLAVIGVLYGGWIAFGQRDMKRILAFATVSHLGLIVLGIFALNPQGLSGALLQMISSGITTGALFLIVGMLAARRDSRDVQHFGGIWGQAPFLGSIALVMVLASIGLPGLSGFIGEFTIMLGAWISPVLGWTYVSIAVIGVVLAAAYLLRMFRLVFMGPPREAGAPLRDANTLESLMLGVLLVPTLVIGLYPNALLLMMEPSVQQIAQQIGQTLASR